VDTETLDFRLYVLRAYMYTYWNRYLIERLAAGAIRYDDRIDLSPGGVKNKERPALNAIIQHAM